MYAKRDMTYAQHISNHDCLVPVAVLSLDKAAREARRELIAAANFDTVHKDIGSSARWKDCSPNFRPAYLRTADAIIKSLGLHAGKE